VPATSPLQETTHFGTRGGDKGAASRADISVSAPPPRILSATAHVSEAGQLAPRMGSDLPIQMAAYRGFGTTGSGGFASARPVLADPESRVLCLEARYTPRVANPITVYVPLCRHTQDCASKVPIFLLFLTSYKVGYTNLKQTAGKDEFNDRYNSGRHRITAGIWR